MQENQTQILDAIFHRRAVKVFESVEISEDQRELILEAVRFAPSSFNMQPYCFYWVQSPPMRQRAAELCMGQSPAKTASALIVAVADIGSWQSTTQSFLQWVRQSGLSRQKVSEHERRAKFGKWFFVQGWFGVLGMLKWIILRTLHLRRIIGMAPVSRHGLFKWATKNTSLACENLLIAAEALGFNTCPMEGFDGRRLSKFLGLQSRYHEIVMVIAVGKKSAGYVEEPRWRRPLDRTVTFL